MHDGPFAPDEYHQRRLRMQAAMDRAGIAALLLTGDADIRYFTGFLTRFWESPTRPWFLILPVSGAPIAVIPAIGAPLMARCGIDDIRTWDAPDYRDDGISLLAEALRGCLPKRAALGLPMGRETALRMPLADWERLCLMLPGHRRIDAAPLLRAVQMVKSPAEVALIEQVCALAGRAFDRVPEMLVPGITLDAVFRRFQGLLLDEGADWVSYVAGAAEQGGYADVISPAAARPLAEGDVLMLDTGAVLGGYFCDFDRNWSIGPASAQVRAANQLLWDATEAGLEAARPGARASDLHAAMAKVLAPHNDGPMSGRLGHGLGLRLTEPPSLIPDDDTTLTAGMVLTLEPSLSLGAGRMIVHEENIVIGEAGARWVSPRAPRSLPELEWTS